MSTDEHDTPRIGSSSSFTDRTTWLRAVFMVLFAVIYWVAEMVLIAVVVLQFLFVLATRAPNGQLLKFGQSLATFIYQIISYLTYNTEERPFPFTDWPSGPPSN